MKEFGGTKLKSTIEEGLGIDDEDEQKEVLGDKAVKVAASSRMADSPCVVNTSEWSANMVLRDSSKTSYVVSEKTMEVAPELSITTEFEK